MSFQVAIQASDRRIVGLGPFDPGDDFGPDYPIVTVADDAELAVLLLPTDPAWLSADDLHVLSDPPGDGG